MLKAMAGPLTSALRSSKSAASSMQSARTGPADEYGAVVNLMQSPSFYFSP